ncbi:hypothetical protein ACFVVP_26345 [Streptomyces sp. NPDC058128]|uniref:hypothetical protein n=1 Tax=Streptomyces sp. NPDC058128 TaxID=3346352 RepID=UPI0036E4F3FF
MTDLFRILVTGSRDWTDMNRVYTHGACFACHQRLSWHAEVVVVDGEILVREWHAVDYSDFQELIDGD